jgi:hypothetical protein
MSVSDIACQTMQIDSQNGGIKRIKLLANQRCDHSSKDIAAATYGQAWVSGSVSVLAISIGYESLMGLQNNHHAGSFGKFDGGILLLLRKVRGDIGKPVPFSWMGSQDARTCKSVPGSGAFGDRVESIGIDYRGSRPFLKQF